MLDVNDFEQLRIGLATADSIRMWSNGEVKKPETINYRTLRPEKDGLFCEKIFGPTKDWECYCGKYKRVRFKGIICERCGVEVTRSKVRRDRMGHIELAAPVVHIWYLRGTRSWLAYLLMGMDPREELKAKQLEKVIYFAANLVTWVDDERRHEELPNLEAEILEELADIERQRDLEIDARFKELEAEVERLESEGAKDSEIKSRQRAAEKEVGFIRERAQAELELVQRALDEFRDLHPRKIIEDELLWRELKDRFGEHFEGGMGAEAIARLIDRTEFDEEETKLREAIDATDGRRPLSVQRKQKAIKRLKIVTAFNRRDENGRRANDPRAMILDAVPVIPPELRPMVQLDGGRFATSDLNDLYRRVINRNNRLKRLLDLGAPEIIVNNEKRMLQEAVDALFDNGRRGRPVTGPGNRPLKSLSDMLKGKQGRFRQNLLGKRVDYSGRSVIVVGPTLKLQQCGLPKQMALELFKPFVMKRLVDEEQAQNIKSAKRMVERRRAQVWDVLEDVIKEHPVFLNRAPTLHRLGIQAFEPVLVEGKAIQVHPLVCAAFNADFDGDQMAVHLPLSSEAQAEARILMLSANNILSPATGRPITVPSHDMVFGAHYLTVVMEGVKGEGRVFRHLHEVEKAAEAGDIDLHAMVTVRTPVASNGDTHYDSMQTTAGRLLFNTALPSDFPFVNDLVSKKSRTIASIVEEIADNYPKATVGECLDKIKDLGFRFATQSGLTISMEDVRTPPEKAAILDRHEKEAEKAETQFKRGIITDDERRQKEIEIWTSANSEVGR
ncbi:MAG: DNA-directed RNA polymerase subunit beta', partial [Actinomycetota bacterium]|nr:DNA-directed RNA polymerase subunit beta' [Actinomycetota bacterium]